MTTDIPDHYKAEAKKMFLQLSEELLVSSYSDQKMLEIAVSNYFRFLSNSTKYFKLQEWTPDAEEISYMSLLGRDSERSGRVYMAAIEKLKAENRKELAIELPPVEEIQVSFPVENDQA